MNISKALSDDAILLELGKRIASRRVDLRLTQAMLAEQAGVSKRTLERLEAGASTQLTNFVRILRELDLLPVLEQLLAEQRPSPMALLRGKGKPPQRVRPSSPKTQEPDPEWQWGDES